MKIVHVYKDYYPPSFGGIEQTVQRLAVGAVRQGDEVTVLTSHPGSRRTLEETVDGVRVIRCAEWGRALSTPFCPAMPFRLARMPADIHHLHYPSPPGELSWLLSRPPGAMVVTWHGHVVRQKALLPLYGPLTHAVLRAADAIMTTSDRQAAGGFLTPYADKIHVVPLGIDLAQFERLDAHRARAEELRARLGAPLTLFIGRLVPYKGLNFLIDAMPRVPGKVVIVGSGPLLEPLRAQAAARGVADRVIFAGRVSEQDLLAYLAAADLGVLPSSNPTEQFGLSMVEMMACGLPVVCTELGTGTSFVNRHGETGLVVAPCDPDALAGALEQLLTDAARRRRMADSARARARLFSTEAMLRGVTRVYQEVLERRRAA